MSTEADTLAPSSCTTVSAPVLTSAEENRTAVPLPVFLAATSSKSKPLRERNRTNLKRRTNLSRSQVLSNDFENEDSLPPGSAINKPVNTDIQTPSTPTIHPHAAELYSKSISPNTPSPIHTTVTCNQVWERLASNEEYQNPSPIKPTTTNSLPTHISFTFSQSDNDEHGDAEDLPSDDVNDFQFIPVTSQSNFARFQFITFAQQQQLNDNSDEECEAKAIITQAEMDDSEEDDDEEGKEEEQENQPSKKRKRSVSTTGSFEGIPTTAAAAATVGNTEATSTAIKAPCTKKPKTKDPNANFQLLNMRKKHFSHAKKHQFSKHKRNAFYRRTRNAGGGGK